MIGIDLAQALCFLAFWALQLIFIIRGTESIRWLETLDAPFLLLAAFALLAWAYVQADGFGDMLARPSEFVAGAYRYSKGWNVKAMIAFGLGVAPNIPGFLAAIEALDNVPGLFISLYHYAWFTGALITGGSYYLFMKIRSPDRPTGN